MEIRIEGFNLPGRACAPSARRVERGRVVTVDFAGYDNVHVGVQKRGAPDELLGLTAGDVPSVVWTINCEVSTNADGVDFKGPYIQGRPRDRFIYLSWGDVDAMRGFHMFRRAKLMLDAISPEVVTAANRTQRLTARLSLIDGRGQPLCAAVRPPLVEWSAS